jgi:hypothetical protein
LLLRLLRVSLLRLLVIVLLRQLRGLLAGCVLRRLGRVLRRLGRIAMQGMHRRRLLVLRLVIVFLVFLRHGRHRRRQRGFVARALHPCRWCRRSIELFFRRIILR